MAAAAAALQVVGAVGETAANVSASDVNAKGLDAQARSIDQQTTFDVTQEQRRNRLMLGKGIARGAASGVSISSGSPLLHELDRVKQASIQEQSIQRSGNINAANTRFASRMERRKIPFQILAGVTKIGSIGANASGGGSGNTGGSGGGSWTSRQPLDAYGTPGNYPTR
jgi:hypothetical protein